MVCLPFIGLGRSALCRAENIAPRAGRTAIAFAMHAIDGVRGAVTVVRRSTVSTIARTRWAIDDFVIDP